ncbi:LuxR C-terminal-related transcriptional regulator [Sinisalibacter lacisalsi]|uniref:HTH luxR-type domain-containing protein n=1 Tax=Sinisalibacter lacisalsi TaxID=1526570 RepID=A0ABQ1QGI8_9RHOB|nr:response regulator transcription factor [Sinisalibacter lacisalsi]GGD25488.1 hypothetical protein GCM10011358_07480 [Sinisalibacter lacisalsi]
MTGLQGRGQFVQVLVALGPGSNNGKSVGEAIRGPATDEPEKTSIAIETENDRVIARFGVADAPDVFLLDFDFPGMSGLAGIRTALDLIADCPLGVLVSTVKPDLASRAMAAGAKAVLPLDMPPDGFRAAIALLRAGVSFAVIDRDNLIRRLHNMASLSEREVQILSGICKGLQNKEIAHAFDIKEVTVKMHVRAIIRKLGARNRTHAAMIARDVGIV